MEQRRHYRVATEQAVKLTVLDDAQTHLVATIKNISGHGLGLFSPALLASGAAVKIEFEDCLYLGEVMYCKAVEEGFFVGIKLTEVLSGLAALSRLAQEFSELLDPAPSRRR